MTEAVVWTVVFFGLDLLVLLTLLGVAVRHDLRAARDGTSAGSDSPG